jgi:hypothetical protein
VKPERAADDQAQLGVHLLDPGVRQSVAKRRLDPGALLGDGAGEFDERLKPAAAGPSQPRVEQPAGLVESDAVDLAQLLGEQVGAVQPLVELLDAGEFQLLLLGEVARVLPEREAGALELGGELLLALAASLVLDLAADVVERVGGELDEVDVSTLYVGPVRVHGFDAAQAPTRGRGPS